MIEAIALAALLQAAAYEGLWTVEIIDNVRVMPESRVTIRLESTASSDVAALSGSASCNTYRGSFNAAVESGVKVSGLLKTMKACDQARMSEEADFFALLNAVASYEVRGDTLLLRTATGKTMTARRVPPTSVP